LVSFDVGLLKLMDSMTGTASGIEQQDDHMATFNTVIKFTQQVNGTLS